jgi:hypothetical protein
MIKCKKCKGKVFVDRVFSERDHLETFCINCGKRDMYHPPSRFQDIKWLADREKVLMDRKNGK